MSFAHAPITKGLMLALGVASFFAGTFEAKHYFQLQLSPHISRDHQYWRLLSHHFVMGNSSELFLAEVLLFHIAVPVERAFGTFKFASFIAVSVLLSTLLSFISLLAFYPVGFNSISAGPTALLMSIIYQYSRITPSAYLFRISKIDFTDKVFLYFLAAQLAICYPPNSFIVSAIGLLVGSLYRADVLGLNTFRLSSPFLHRFSKNYLLPLIGPTNLPHRTNRAFPDLASVRARLNPILSLDNENEQPITTAPSMRSSTSPASSIAPSQPSIIGHWVDEITGRGNASGVRVPTPSEITQLAGMFPDVPRDTILQTLQRSPDLERAVETMLVNHSADTGTNSPL